LEKGTGADRQLEIYEQNKSFEAVAAYIESKFLGTL
jgi:hypothetical protein